MEEWVTGLMAAALIPILALVAKVIIAKILDSKKIEILSTDERGNTETVIVRASASPSEIRDRLAEAYLFEAEIAGSLARLQAKSTDLKSHTSRNVDFVVEMRKNQFELDKLALEVKLALDRVDEAALAKYLTAEQGLGHLLLVSRLRPSDRVLKKLETLVAKKDVSLLTIPKGSDPDPLIEQMIRRIATGNGGLKTIRE